MHDAVDLVNVVLAREERSVGKELGKDGAHSPHVDRKVILACAKQELRSAVPSARVYVCVRVYVSE